MSRDKTDERFPILVYDEETFADFTLTTRFKIVDGEVEQMAGIAFGILDDKNYSYVRASALGGTFSLFRGLAEALTQGVDAFTRFPDSFLFLGSGFLAGLPVQFVHNPDYATGLGSSLKAGVAMIQGQLRNTVADYGVTWDEDVHAYYGNLVVEYYAAR